MGQVVFEITGLEGLVNGRLYSEASSGYGRIEYNGLLFGNGTRSHVLTWSIAVKEPQITHMALDGTRDHLTELYM
jgi:hypothetical protein